jgi:hypothetical protein
MSARSRLGLFSSVFVAGGAASIVIASLVSACGARTGLEVPPPEPVDAADAHDANDTMPPRSDAKHDADADVEAEADVVIDVVDRCADAGTTYIYVFTEANHLVYFDPAVGAFGPIIGTLDCPLIDSSSTPFSMAVDRSGLAYVLYQDGELFKVSTKDARCRATSFAATDPDFTTFGMGFTANKTDPGETLYVLGYAPGSKTATLGTIDTTTFDLTHVGSVEPALAADGELTGTSDGRLFSYAVTPTDMTTAQFLELDPTNAKTIDRKTLPVPPGSAWAFGFWGGDFYLFNAPNNPDGSAATSSNVTRYRPSDGSVATIATYGELIVGAGVSTCAPTAEP